MFASVYEAYGGAVNPSIVIEVGFGLRNLIFNIHNLGLVDE